MPKSIFFLFFISILSSCAIKKQLVSKQELIGDPFLKIKSYNLSEDLSRVSSNNDEILIIIYKLQDTLTEPLIMEYLIFDEKQNTHTIPLDKEQIFTSGFFLFLLEMDTDQSSEEIESLVRPNAAALEKSFQEKDRIAQKKILGDDDILGFRRITKDDLQNFSIYNFFGYHKMDRYEYELEFLGLKK